MLRPDRAISGNFPEIGSALGPIAVEFVGRYRNTFLLARGNVPSANQRPDQNGLTGVINCRVAFGVVQSGENRFLAAFLDPSHRHWFHGAIAVLGSANSGRSYFLCLQSKNPTSRCFTSAHRHSWRPLKRLP